MVLHKVLRHAPGGGDFIAQAPADDGGVVVVLHNQLRHLAEGVLPGLGHVLGNVGYLRPHHQALLAAQIAEILVVLAVGQPHRIGPHFQQQGDILLLLPAGDGIAHPLAVLVPGRAAQPAGASVEDKALLRVHGKAAAPEPGGNAVAACFSCPSSRKVTLFAGPLTQACASTSAERRSSLSVGVT